MKKTLIGLLLYYLVWVITGDSINPFEWATEVQYIFGFCSVVAMMMYYGPMSERKTNTHS